MMQGLVSVIMPIYNAEETLAAAIRSVQAQTYPHWELLAVDDASKDDSVAIVLSLARKEPRIRLLTQEQNGGVAQARNRGIREAQGQYLAFLDSDDLWRPEKLTKQIAFMEAHHAAISATAYSVIDETGKRAGADRRFRGVQNTGRKLIRKAQGRKDISASTDTKVTAQIDFYSFDYRELLKGNALGCLTVMIDREALQDQGFSGEISFPQIRHEDYALWLSILKQGSEMGLKAYALDEVLADYRINSASISGNKWKSVRWTYEIYRNYLGLGRVESVRCFLAYLFSAVAKRVSIER